LKWRLCVALKPAAAYSNLGEITSSARETPGDSKRGNNPDPVREEGGKRSALNLSHRNANALAPRVERGADQTQCSRRKDNGNLLLECPSLLEKESKGGGKWTLGGDSAACSFHARVVPFLSAQRKLGGRKGPTTPSPNVARRKGGLQNPPL